ncbi:MAG: DUF4959 domain-containing protein [Dysgonamonadaceae bacterium]|jgi:hypothetical protein|nr:DUF4959 domain-containing protein [Dysgonamonadaceae bacterium]
MKSSYLLLILFVISTCWSCKEEPIGLQPVDSKAPGPVTNVTYKPLAGGASIRYTLPDDEDLLYVKAVFNRNGSLCESRATIYTDSLLVEGFGDTQPKTIQLIAVDRSRNESTPVALEITPDKPDVFRIAESLQITPDFGGIHLYWDNPNKREVSVWLMIKDSINPQDYIPFETYYTSAALGNVVKNGMDTIPTDVAVFVQDRWENRTEPIYLTLTPLYETHFDRLKHRIIELPGDAPGATWWPKAYCIDGIWGINDNCYASDQVGVWPQTFTIDLGIVGKISRVRIHQRVGAYTWIEGNLRNFEVYGRSDINLSDGSMNGWQLLKDCESVKPSGLPFGQHTDEDYEVALNGEDFTFDPNNPPVRYVRFRVTRTWAGGTNFQVSEIEFFGDDRY